MNAFNLPPADLQAEQKLLGAIMANNLAVARASRFLKAEHFADPIHGQIYGAILGRVDAGHLADAVTLKDWAETGVLRKVGGRAYLGKLQALADAPLDVGASARSIRMAWVRRLVIDATEVAAVAATQARDAAFRGDLTVANIVATGKELEFAGRELAALAFAGGAS